MNNNTYFQVHLGLFIGKIVSEIQICALNVVSASRLLLSTDTKRISSHSAGKGQFSFQSQRKAMPKNVQITAQLCSSHMLASESESAQSCPTLCDPMAYIVKEFSRPEYWSGQPFPSPGDLPKPGTKSRSPTLWADSLQAELQGCSKFSQPGFNST